MRSPFVVLCFLFVLCGTLLGEETDLRRLLGNHGIEPLAENSKVNANQFDLGRSLFFDRELSGNRDVSCASCHHPSTSSGDSRVLPSGVHGEGLGPLRTQDADREMVPRNSPEVFHRGNEGWTSMFWDSRLTVDGSDFTSPAGKQLPAGFDSVLQVQAMFPVTSRAEMRGNPGDVDIHGRPNEIADIANDDFVGIWSALRERLMAIPAYRTALTAAFPSVPEAELGYQHAAKAIAEFEKEAFSPNDSAWDRYVAGDESALSDAAKRGATHFYGGDCASCHSGNLMTDQQHHNVGVPQLGPGKDASHLDIGRALETGNEDDMFSFRTPPLRNVTLTGPWMHNGAFTNLEDVIRHKYDPGKSLEEYDNNQLPEHIQPTVKDGTDTLDAIMSTLDPMLPVDKNLSEEKLEDLMAFMASLTSPSADLMLNLTPNEVLSGLAVEQQPDSGMDVLYDPLTGGLSIAGRDDVVMDALFLRISDDANGVAGFEFVAETAPWASDMDIMLSDSSEAQSFLDYRTDPTFLFSAGDEISGLLPVDLLAEEVASHLTAVFRAQGSPVLWSATVQAVPEPDAGAMLLLSSLLLFSRWHQRD